ncbi:class I SAM-dependent methyltransferase [Sphingomonas sp. H39-1-10]|uniref:class I SAM-dependent methyltransferase n=1 Tax=Sphingomonas pollutisoli TaxID=3030829 RepID=UPI0023B9CB18|nr:class I SAM-dependent methyltransferase [Sphingomonas pollutisoli]MDF0490965.1 class I SAM-dependent methyltransferase [Sphingomonas pollutisoli]
MDLLPSPPARILDMGCGGGWTSVFLARRGFEVVGQDIAPDMIELARENKARQGVELNLTFVCADYESMMIDATFDAVIFFDCLHHSEDERAAIEMAYRSLKPGGVLITHEPGEGHATAPGSIEAMKLFGVTERDMPPHVIIGHGRAVGFSDHRVFPMQSEIRELFYRHPVPKIASRRGFLLAKRVLKAAFRPSERASSIVTLIK